MNFNYMLTHIRPLIADRSLKFPILKDGSGHYGDLFDAEVKRVLDIHVLLRTGGRCCGQHGSCHLLDEACQAKQQCRRLERWYRRTGLQSDKEVSLSACSTALQSRADHIKSELDESAGDVRATWRMAQRLLHSRHKVMYDDAQCAQLVSMFCQFLVDKVRRICDNISAALQSSVRRTFAVHQHLGPQLSSFEPVTAEEVRKLLSGMPAVQVVTTRCPSVLVTQVVCSRVAASHCQTRKPVTADWKVSCPIQESAGASTAEEGRARQYTASELQADLQPADRVQGPGETRVGTPAAPLAQL